MVTTEYLPVLAVVIFWGPPTYAQTVWPRATKNRLGLAWASTRRWQWHTLSSSKIDRCNDADRRL